MTGRNEAYYTDYLGTPQEFVSAAKWGYLYQGQRYKWQKKSRGRPAFDLDPSAFVNFLQNHDQVANSACGLRCHALASPGTYRASVKIPGEMDVQRVRRILEELRRRLADPQRPQIELEYIERLLKDY